MVAMSRFENDVTRTYLLLGGKRTINAPRDCAGGVRSDCKRPSLPHFYTW